MSYLSALKKSSTLDFDHLAKVIEEQNNPPRNTKVHKDERFWKPERDKAGNAYAVIRFLPPALVNGVPEDVCWVRMFDHGFQGPTGKWYIEKSLTTIGQQDPLSEYNSYLWNMSEGDADTPERKIARKQKRRLQYISNILVMSDPKNPQNEGKVFLYQYGKKVYDKIQGAMFPKIPGMPKINPFDPVAGANFNLFIEQVAGFPNYDQSRFEGPSPLGSNADIDTICPQAYSLKDLVTPDKFKSRAELQNHLNEVLGFDVGEVVAAAKIGRPATGNASNVGSSVPRIKTAEDRPVVVEDEEDDDLKQFKALVS